MSAEQGTYLYARTHRQLWGFFDDFLAAFKLTDYERKRLLERLGMLTPREREVLIMLCRGYSNKDIAILLAISPDTARMHIRKVFWKLGLPDARHVPAVMFSLLVSLRES